MSRLLNVSIEDMGPLALTSNQKIPVNAQCVIFAESEIIQLLHSNTPTEDICKAILGAMASRIVTLISRIGDSGELVMRGAWPKTCHYIICKKQFTPGEHPGTG